MVFNGEVEQVGGLLLDAAVEVFIAKDLDDVAEDSLEAVVLLVALAAFH